MNCEICGKGMKEGVTLIRQNEKGVKGIWRCLTCNKAPIDVVTKAIVKALNAERKGE